LIVVDWRLAVGLLALPAAVGAALAVSIDVDETAAVGASDSRADGGTEGIDDGPDRPDDGVDGADDQSSDGDARATGSVSSPREFLADSRRLFSGAFLLVFAIIICSGLYYRGVTTFLPDLLGELPMLGALSLGEVTLEPSRFVYAGLLMVGIAGQYVGGKLTDRVPTERGLAAGFGALAVVALLFQPAAGAGLVPLLVASALLGFFLFVVQPMYQATVAEYSPPEARGLSYGYTYLGVFGMGASGAVIAGAVLTHASAWGLFLLFAGIAALAAALGVVLSLRGHVKSA
jgi:MFS family permease